jgi:uncharacterized protein HemX
MAEGGIRPPRIRMPRLTLPGRASRRASEKTTVTRPKAAEGPGSGDKPAETKPAQPAAGKAAAGAKTPEPNLQERMEGLQGWMAEIERKQARLTYFGVLALLIAIGAAGAALYFGLTAHSDSAKKTNLDQLSKRVDSLQGAVTKNSKDTQNALNASIAQLQQSISGLQKQQAQAAANISTLQSQVASGALNKGTAPGAAPALGGNTTTTTPGGNKRP